MAWIKFDKDLVNDPRIIRAAEGLATRYTMSIEGTRGYGFATGSDLSEKEITEVMRNAVIGALVTLWVYADTHITGRDVLRISVSAIDQLVGIDGFCEAVGPEWIKEDEDTYGVFTVLPGYCEKNGVESKEKRKASNAERQRRFREKLKLAKGVESCGNSNGISNAVSNAGVTPSRPRPRPRPIKDKGESLTLPDWLPVDAWQAWLEIRPKVKAPNTPKALSLALRDLETLRASGQDPRIVLEEATVKGWRGLYASKGNGAAKIEPGPGKKLCAYCESVATGMVSGIWYCPSHARNAIDGDAVPRMRGVQAKAVAGE